MIKFIFRSEATLQFNWSVRCQFCQSVILGGNVIFSSDIQDIRVIFLLRYTIPVYDLLGPYACHSCCNMQNI